MERISQRHFRQIRQARIAFLSLWHRAHRIPGAASLLIRAGTPTPERCRVKVGAPGLLAKALVEAVRPALVRRRRARDGPAYPHGPQARTPPAQWCDTPGPTWQLVTAMLQNQQQEPGGAAAGAASAATAQVCVGSQRCAAPSRNRIPIPRLRITRPNDARFRSFRVVRNRISCCPAVQELSVSGVRRFGATMAT